MRQRVTALCEKYPKAARIPFEPKRLAARPRQFKQKPSRIQPKVPVKQPVGAPELSWRRVHRIQMRSKALTRSVKIASVSANPLSSKTWPIVVKARPAVSAPNRDVKRRA